MLKKIMICILLEIRNLKKKIKKYIYFQEISNFFQQCFQILLHLSYTCDLINKTQLNRFKILHKINEASMLNFLKKKSSVKFFIYTQYHI